MVSLFVEGRRNKPNITLMGEPEPSISDDLIKWNRPFQLISVEIPRFLQFHFSMHYDFQ